MIALKEHMQEAHMIYKEMSSVTEKRDTKAEFAYRSQLRDLHSCAKEWDQLVEQMKEIEEKLGEIDHTPPRYV